MVFAVLSLIDYGRHGWWGRERVALEHGATLLALELSRLQLVSSRPESRLGSGLLEEELLAGTDDDQARIRTQVLGYDLGVQQRVAVVAYPSTVSR